MKDAEKMDTSAIREEILRRLKQRDEALDLLTKQKEQVLEQIKDLKTSLLEKLREIEAEITALESIKARISAREKKAPVGERKEKADTATTYQAVLHGIRKLPFINNIKQVRPGRSSYLTNTNKRLILRYSKRLQHLGKPLFFYGLPFKFLVPNNLVLFICASPDNVLLVPTNDILPYKDSLQYREKGKYYYFHIYNEEGSYVLRISKNKKLDLTKYLNLYELLH